MHMPGHAQTHISLRLHPQRQPLTCEGQWVESNVCPSQHHPACCWQIGLEWLQMMLLCLQVATLLLCIQWSLDKPTPLSHRSSQRAEIWYSNSHIPYLQALFFHVVSIFSVVFCHLETRACIPCWWKCSGVSDPHLHLPSNLVIIPKLLSTNSIFYWAKQIEVWWGQMWVI
jgi:hypothetical protein